MKQETRNTISEPQDLIGRRLMQIESRLAVLEHPPVLLRDRPAPAAPPMPPRFGLLLEWLVRKDLDPSQVPWDARAIILRLIADSAHGHIALNDPRFCTIVRDPKIRAVLSDVGKE